MGMDKTIVYNRKEEVFPFVENKSNKWESYLDFSKQINGGMEQNKFIIGFCGKIYSVVEFSWIDTRKPYIPERIVKYFYSQEEYLYFKSISITLQKKLPDKIGNISRSLFKDISIYDKSKLYKYFDQYKTPIFIIRKADRGYDDDVIEINCQLKPFEFYRIYDPYSAFQEIQMYISGVLGIGQPQLIQIGNKEMIQKKGFDKWSFRKMPEKTK
jgi:hypothetical protein